MGTRARRRQGRAGAGARVAGGRHARRRWQVRRHGWTRRQAWSARRARQARARTERTGRAGWALGARPGRAGWPWAVHSVHSACFWPGSTRYFPESKFLDIVREPGS